MPGFYSEYPSFDRPVRGSNHNHGCTICQRNSWLRRHPDSIPKPQGSWLDGPHVPGPSKESIQALKCRDVEETSSSPKIGVQEAFGLACKALEGYHREVIVCINQSKWGIYHQEDLPFMVFDQLDKELFRSVLKGRVYLSWARCPQAVTKRAEEDSKIIIELPEWFKVEANSISILATLVHQMVHAYFLQCCGYQDKDVRGPAYNLGHGFEFKGLLRLIGNCCPESASRYLWEPLPQPRGYSDRFWQSQPQAGRSNCSSFRNHYPTGAQRLDCKQWCDEAIAVTNSLADSRQAQEKKKQIEDTPSAK